jgi:DNA-binding beta-propeller fold protein YncE
MTDRSCVAFLLSLFLIANAPTVTRAQPALWRELWQPAESEVQMARPCSRVDLTHIAAGGRFVAISHPSVHTVALYDVGDDRFAPAGNIGGRGKNANQFDTPSGVAIDAQRRLLFVSDTNNHRIQVFRLAKPGTPAAVTFAKSFGVHGSELGQLDRPTGLSLDAGNNLYVLEQGNMRVQVYSPDLVPQRVFGSAQELRTPIAIAAAPSGEVVYVADAGLRGVQVFGSDGRVRATIGRGRSGTEQPRSAGAFFYPAGVAVSKDGTVLVSDCGDHVVQRFDARGAVLTPWGQFGPAPGALNQPRAITVDERDRVIVLDFSGRRAQMFTPTGAFTRAIKLVAQAKDAVAPSP